MPERSLSNTYLYFLYKAHYSLVFRTVDHTSSLCWTIFKQLNYQPEVQKCKNYDTNCLEKDTHVSHENRNKKAEYQLVQSQLALCASGTRVSDTLCMSTNDHKNIVSVHFGVMNLSK